MIVPRLGSADRLLNEGWQLSGRLAAIPFGLSRANIRAAIVSGGRNSIGFLRRRDALSAAIKVASARAAVIPAIRLHLPSGAVLRLAGVTPEPAPPSPRHGSSQSELEQLAFTFQRIELENGAGGGHAADDWT